MLGEYKVALSGTPAPEGWELVERPQTAVLIAGWLRQGLVRRTLIDICRALGVASIETLAAKAADTRISETIERGFRDGRLKLYRRKSLGGGGGTGEGNSDSSGGSGGPKPPPRPLPPTPKKKVPVGFKVVDEDGNAVAAKISVKLPDGSTRTMDLAKGHDFWIISNLEEGGECEVSLPSEYDPEWQLGRGDPIG